MMIVLEQFAHHQKVQGEAVLAMIVVVVIGIAVFMPAPVNEGAMDRAHEKMDGQQEEQPPMGSENHIESDVPDAEGDPRDPKIADAVDKGPVGVRASEGRFGLLPMKQIVHINIFCLHGHIPDVFKKVRGVRILFGVAISVVHAVEDGVGAGVQERRALAEKSEGVKELFPEFVHLKHLMRSIAVKEEGLRE